MAKDLFGSSKRDLGPTSSASFKSFLVERSVWKGQFGRPAHDGFVDQLLYQRRYILIPALAKR
jgi:hypothetical protein